MDKKDIYRSIIVGRSSKPFNKINHSLSGYMISNANVSTCQDDFDIFIKYDEVIEDIKFSGSGCSISTAVLDIFSEYLVGKTKKEAIKFIENYRNMIKGTKFDAKELKDLIALENVSSHLNRVSCALIGPNTIKVMLGGKNE